MVDTFCAEPTSPVFCRPATSEFGGGEDGSIGGSFGVVLLAGVPSVATEAGDAEVASGDDDGAGCSCSWLDEAALLPLSPVEARDDSSPAFDWGTGDVGSGLCVTKEKNK